MPDDAKPGAVSARGATGFSMKAPDFSGEGSFSRFSDDLENFFTLHAFSDDLKLRFLPLCLTGVARDAFEALPADGRDTYARAMRCLSESFRRPCALDVHAKLRSLQFDTSKSLDAFVIQFKRLISEAFPGPLSDQVLFHTFLPTLPPKFQEHIIAQGIGTFEETVQRVRNLIQSERFQQPVRQVSAATKQSQEEGRSRPDMLEQILARIEAIEQRMSESSRPRGRGGTGAGGGAVGRQGCPASEPRACFCCGDTGHLRASCPARDGFCARCGRRGHTVAVCWSRGNGRGVADSGSVDRRPL